MADQVLYSGVACITDLMVKEGLINLDFADVRAVMREMGKAMMGTGEASGEKPRAWRPPKPRSPIRCSTKPR
jgi:cell division protein FtsZ